MPQAVYHEDREYGSDFPVEIVRFGDFSFRAHWHSEIELLRVVEGRITVGVNSESRLLGPGEGAVCASGDLHWYDTLPASSVVDVLVFRPEILETVLPIPADFHIIQPFLLQEDGDPAFLEDLRWTFDRIRSEMDRKAPHFKAQVVALLAGLMVQVLRHAPPSLEDSAAGSEWSASKKQIRKAIKYLELNYSLPVRLDDVARHLGVSDVHFSRLFNEVVGMNFKAYLNRLRVDKADHRVRATDDPIIEIAYDCGFGSIRTFNRAFLDLKGVTPTTQRARHRPHPG
jgi:AraC-like DNA-binding protein